MNSILKISIWAPGAIPVHEWKYRNLKRVMFPAIDFLFILAGLSAALFGVPSISEFFPDHTVDGFALMLSLVSLICLIGVSFPFLWMVEMIGKALLLGLMSGYFISLLILTSGGSDSKGFILLVSAVSLCPIIWRLSLLGSEWQERRILAREG